MLLLKISLAGFFLRALVRTWHRYIIYASVALSTTFSVAYFFFTLFQCGFFTNILEFGIKRVTGKQCVSPQWAVSMGYAYAVITATTDIIFVALPIIVLRGTKMGKREKGTVCFIMALAAM